jgi:hypothetical protein
MNAAATRVPVAISLQTRDPPLLEEVRDALSNVGT